MGSETGVKWIIVLTIYFLCLSFIFTGMNALQTEFGLNSDVTSLSDNDGDKCLEPREFKTGLYDSITKSIDSDEIDCKKYDYNQLECNEVVGCTWEAEPSWFFGIGDSEYCSGTVDVSNYGYTDSIENLTNVCSQLDLNNNKHNCELLRCSYYEKPKTLGGVDEFNPSGYGITSVGSIGDLFLSTLGDMFTLRIDFNTDSSFMNVIFNIVFTLLPLFILIGAIIVVIRA